MHWRLADPCSQMPMAFYRLPNPLGRGKGSGFAHLGQERFAAGAGEQPFADGTQRFG